MLAGRDIYAKLKAIVTGQFTGAVKWHFWLRYVDILGAAGSENAT